MNLHLAQQSRQRTTIVRTAAVAGLISLGLSGHAIADATWAGGTSQDWNDATNWSTNPPDGNFIINTAAGNTPVLSGPSAFTPVDIFVGDGVGNSGQLDQTGSVSLAVVNESGNWMMVGRNGGTGTYNLTGAGALTVGKLQAGGAYYAPGGTGTININTTGTVTATSTAGYDYIFGGSSYASVVLGVGDFGPNLGTGTLNLQNGTLNAAGEVWVGSHGGTGTLTQTGGTINTSGLSLTRWRGAGTVSVTNGTINTGFVNLTHAGSAGDLVTGTLNVGTGSTVSSAGDVTIAFAGNGDSQGTLNVATGGVFNVGTTSERWLVVSLYDTVKGTVNVDGGTINLNGNSDLRFSTGGNSGAAVVNLNSGAITAWGGNQTDAPTDSVVDLNRGGNAGTNSTFNLNGGTLTTNQVISTVDAGTRVLNFNGGTLKAAGASAAFVTGLPSATVSNGGARIDSNGHDVAIAVPLVAGSGSTGGLVKTGTGTLTLSGANSYTGTTTVQAGTLALGINAQAPVLTGAGGADVQGGSLVLDYTGGSSPVASVKSILDAGFAGGFATGQVRSTTRVAGSTLGYGDNGSAVIVRVTLAGDADLDGDVDFNDFLSLQTSFGSTGTRFDQGNFNYDGATDFNDFLALQTNFGQSIGADTAVFTDAQYAQVMAITSANAVPEPASLALLGLGAAGLIGRRRGR